MHDVDIFGIQTDADSRANRLEVGGLDQPFEALEIHDDIVIQALEGDGSNRTGQMAFF